MTAVTRAANAPRRTAVVWFVVAALLAALLAPLTSSATTYLLPAGIPVPAGTQVLEALPIADALLVSSPTPPEGAVRADSPLVWRSLADTADPATGVRLDSGVASLRAPQVWQTTTRGEGALVALVDTGVADVPATRDALVAELDFTDGGGGDGYGHGTFMAALIAGRGSLAPGVAPAAGILSLKVATADGTTELGTLLTALQWLAGPGRDTGVTVAALALGMDPGSPAGALLDLAVGRLAAAGVLVITASGNEAGKLGSPATAAGSFSVGAVDDQGTAHRADDRMAAFSGSGLDRLGVAQPDVVASGVRVVSSMPCSAQLAVQHPGAFVDGGLEACAAGADAALLRGSGTSMSTALAAGVAALASSANQALGAPGLDTSLRARAAGDPPGLHAHALDAPAAVAAAMALEVEAVESGGVRKGFPPTAGPPAHAVVRGVNWRGVNWRGVNWRGVNWRDSDWQGVNWRGVNWRDSDWLGVNWRGVNWRGTDWAMVGH